MTVADNGEGIPPENLAKIFDPFFTTKPDGKGVGLGLAVSFGIIQAHGGEIEVKSVVGEGTTFTVSLPLEQPAPPGGAVVPAGINTNETVYLVRHAEAHPTSWWEDGNYIAAGQWRALDLPYALRGKI